VCSCACAQQTTALLIARSSLLHVGVVCVQLLRSALQQPPPAAVAKKPKKAPDVSQTAWPTIIMTPQGPVPDLNCADYEVSIQGAQHEALPHVALLLADT
jgi:hypothetical protein